MQKANTLAIVGSLIDLGITRISIKEDPNPIHNHKDRDFIVVIHETVYHKKLIEVMKLVSGLGMCINVTEDIGLEIFEAED